MTMRGWVAAAVLAVLGGAAVGEENSRVADFALRDDRGREHRKEEWREAKAVVLLFLGVECPVSNGYAPEFRRIAEAYSSRGVTFYGLHPDPDVTGEAARQHAAEYGLPFPILLDPSQVVARQAGVKLTPEAVVLASDGRILYRGRIDDRYDPRGRRREVPTSRDLRDALNATLAGRAPKPAAGEAFGCHLPRLTTPAPASTPVRGTRP